ncbi:hypothetical protein [Mesorhizobium huakuii]|uniref:Uncharacterized protein n=1 Tax=Mesorhizobium huakuii TaxID=28104 RepID=A0A7G6SNY4_9HYPH|nr:hypothetical protein [Mesorhizobium huakuii]QND56216.1 hypothetical protein HB778_05900 [Mesorhizobium huakuii]
MSINPSYALRQKPNSKSRFIMLDRRNLIGLQEIHRFEHLERRQPIPLMKLVTVNPSAITIYLSQYL